jgi:hypothetical protein
VWQTRLSSLDRAPQNMLQMNELCTKFSILDAYLWLAQRFPSTFVHSDVVRTHRRPQPHTHIHIQGARRALLVTSQAEATHFHTPSSQPHVYTSPPGGDAWRAPPTSPHPPSYTGPDGVGACSARQAYKQRAALSRLIERGLSGPVEVEYSHQERDATLRRAYAARLQKGHATGTVLRRYGCTAFVCSAK